MKRIVEVVVAAYTDKPIHELVASVKAATGGLDETATVGVHRNGVLVDRSGGKWKPAHESAISSKYAFLTCRPPAGVVWRRDEVPIWYNGSALPDRDQYFLGRAEARWVMPRHGLMSRKLGTHEEFPIVGDIDVVLTFSGEPAARRVIDRFVYMGCGQGAGSFMVRDGEIVAVSINTDRSLPMFIEAR